MQNQPEFLPLHLPQFPLIATLLEYMLQNDIEYAASAFYQALFQLHFRIETGWIAVCEQSPDGGRDRMDIAVHYHDPQSPHGLFRAAITEMKRQGSREDSEAQALRYAKKCVEKYGLSSIFTLSIREKFFKLGIYWAGGSGIDPFFRDHSDWISIIEPKGAVLYQWFNAIQDLDAVEDDWGKYRQYHVPQETQIAAQANDYQSEQHTMESTAALYSSRSLEGSAGGKTISSESSIFVTKYATENGFYLYKGQDNIKRRTHINRWEPAMVDYAEAMVPCLVFEGKETYYMWVPEN